MTKDTTKEAAVAAEALLLDDWFDAIEDGVRARARGFIETVLEEQLSEALSRPRYGRRKPGGDEAAPSVVGVRHGHRERTLTGTFGKTRMWRELDSAPHLGQTGGSRPSTVTVQACSPRSTLTTFKPAAGDHAVDAFIPPCCRIRSQGATSASAS